MISVVIPVYLREENKQKIIPLLTDCISSIRGCDEFILQFDELGEGFAKTVNKGILRATGDFIAIVNDDTKMLHGSLKEMCHKGCLTRPKLIGGDLAKFSFVVLDREVIDKVGLMDERFEVGFYEDDDFLDRCIENQIPFVDSPLQVWHYGGATIQDIKGDFEQKNKELYENIRSLRNKS
jgi:GT2 family glycosyltransferase